MEITGRHRVPAALSRLREALRDRVTTEACLPPDVVFVSPGGHDGALRVRAFDRDTVAVPVGTDDQSQASFRLSPAESGRSGWTARFDAELTEAEGAFTLVSWRWFAEGDAPDADRLTALVDAFLERIGQHAAVPLTMAADGLSGVAATVAEAVPTARESPFGPLLARIEALPRELAIGGALFAVVLLIVVGIF